MFFISARVVIFAMDNKTGKNAVDELQKMQQFSGSGWAFRLCSDVKSLLNERSPDVLVVSRSLPGLDKKLPDLKKRFSGSRVVFLIGRRNEAAKMFMARVGKLGFALNFVTGELPGDRPYSLPVALTRDYRDVVGETPVVEQVAMVSLDKGGERNSWGAVCLMPLASLGRVDLVHTVSFDRAAALKKAVGKQSFDAVLVQSDHRDALTAVKELRKSGYAKPILLVGDYMSELISAGATGHVRNLEQLNKFLKIAKKVI